MADLATTWKIAKKVYEDKTAEKKPSKTFLGIRTGSGIEAPLATIDKAKAPLDGIKAATAFTKAAKEFESLIQKRIKEVTAEKDAKRTTLITTEGKQLLKVLSTIEIDVKKKVSEHQQTYVKDKIAAKALEISKLTIAGLIKDKAWRKRFRDYALTEMSTENVDFLAAVQDKVAPAKIFADYLAKGAKFELNISNSDFKAVRDPSDPTKMKSGGMDLKGAIKSTETNAVDTFHRFTLKLADEWADAVKKEVGL